ncbi:MAG: glycosyltransferase family 4 protein, partial [Chloroflexota bacterium]|nr:glycosyltransferase family 4 protein [Chloroflexota bacterium]
WFKSQVKELVESQPYDVIHFHNISLIGPGALAYGNAIKLQTLHEHWLICPMHILWRFDREVCTQRNCFFCTIHGRRPPQLWRYTGFLDRQLKHIDQFISPSRFTRKKHLEIRMDLPITVLPYFVPRIPDATDDTPPSPRPYFLFVGRLVKVKGLQTLLPVFQNYPQADLLVVGEGEYEARLREWAHDIPNVKFLGALPQTRLRALYRDAIAVIMPSICFEVFGIIQIEAFAVKTPVIVRDLGGMPEPIEDSNGGFVFQTDQELVQAMTRLQENPTLRNTLGENGHAAYVKLWSEEAHLKKYFEIIASVGEHKDAPVE